MLIKTFYKMKPPVSARLIQKQLSKGLVGYWLLNEGSGERCFDSSGRGNTGTFQGTNPSWTLGKFGPAVSLPGNGERIQVEDNPSLDFGAYYNFTVVALIKTSYGGLQRLVEKRTTSYGAGGIGFNVEIFSGGILAAGIGDGSNFIADSTQVHGTALDDGNWHHIAVVFDRAGDVMGYVDGYSDGTSVSISAVGDISNSEVLAIGEFLQGPGNSFNGLIDHVIIYNRKLEASDINLLSRKPFCMFDKRDVLIAGEKVNN